MIVILSLDSAAWLLAFLKIQVRRLQKRRAYRRPRRSFKLCQLLSPTDSRQLAVAVCATAYKVLERCPQALPSFAGLSTEMQESIKLLGSSRLDPNR